MKMMEMPYGERVIMHELKELHEAEIAICSTVHGIILLLYNPDLFIKFKLVSYVCMAIAN